MELLQIVDQNGNFTGEIMERDEAHNKNLLHNEISVFVINDKGQILLQKRSTNKKSNPNKWGLCSGHVDAYEKIEEAAIRELKEEIGLEIKLEELHPLAEREIILRESNSHLTYYFYVSSNLEEKDFVIQTEELTEVKWLDIDTIIDMINSNDDTITLKENRLKYLEQLKKIVSR